MTIPAALILTLCAPGPRVSCVTDGDTIWLSGEKIRIANIDAPDMPGDGRCTQNSLRRLANSRNRPWCDAVLYRRAGEALAGFLSSGRIAVERVGVDRYGRTLGRLTVNGVDAGEWLVSRGLARPWVK